MYIAEFWALVVVQLGAFLQLGVLGVGCARGLGLLYAVALLGLPEVQEVT